MIKYENVTNFYGRKMVPAVDGINLEGRYCLIEEIAGLNGAGKNTKIRMVAGIAYSWEGTIKINGYDIIHDGKKASCGIGPISELPNFEGKFTKVKELEDEFMNSTSWYSGFIIYILAVFYGYYSLGKDSVDGTIESTLVRPVTKTGLLSSRYAASVMILGIAAILGSFLSSLLVFHYSGYFLSTGAVLLLSFSIVVSAAGIIGLIYFLSNFLRTVGSLMVVGIFLFIFFSIIWNIALLFIPGIFYPAGSVDYGRLGMALNFLNPFSYISIAVGVYTKSIFISLYEYTASSTGLTYTTFFAGSLVWILVPYALAIMVWNRRD